MPRWCLFGRRCRVLLVVAVALSTGLLANARRAAAQPAIETAIQRPASPSPDEREALYSHLKNQASVLESQAEVVKTVAKLVGPTVVHVEADVSERSSPRFGGGNLVEEAGSGVIVQLGDKHYVLTNRHVINGASEDRIKINLFDGRQIHPLEVWHDPDTDVAVMAVSVPDLVAAPLGDSRTMEIGDFVLAVGSPFGLSYSVTYGIISAKGRRGLELGKSGLRLQNFLQTDAAINPGNSGGPLINLRGEVIGINTAIASNSGGSEGIGFAIPIDMFMFVARQLVEKGEVSRAFLGVTLDSKFGPVRAVEEGLPRAVGAMVTGITPNSPAAAAKLQDGDVILQFDGIPIEDDAHLVNLVDRTEIGKEISLIVFRDREPILIKVTVGDRDDFDT